MSTDQLTGGIVKPIVWGATKAAAVQQFCADNDVAVQNSYFATPTAMRNARVDVAACRLSTPGEPALGAGRAEAAVHGWPVMCLTSGRRGPVRALRHLARHVRHEEDSA